MGFAPGRCGRGVGSGATLSVAPFGCASPEVDVAGVVEVEDPTAEEFSVDDDFRRETPFSAWPFTWPLSVAECFSSSSPQCQFVMSWCYLLWNHARDSVLPWSRLFLRRLERKEGIAGDVGGLCNSEFHGNKKRKPRYHKLEVTRNGAIRAVRRGNEGGRCAAKGGVQVLRYW